MMIKQKYAEILKYIANSILPIVFWVSLIFGFDSPDMAMLTIIAALTHELGHISAIVLTGRTGRIRSRLDGFRIRASLSGYSAELITLAAGPMANILFFLASIPFFEAGNGYAMAFGYINALSAASNLIPIEGFDGYGILYTAASAANSFTLIRALKLISFSLSLLLSFAALYLMLRYGGGYWIFAIFFLSSVTKMKNLLDHQQIY